MDSTPHVLLTPERPDVAFEVPPVYRTPPNPHGGKHIVVCADGTGNADIKGRGSNVFKLFEAVDTSGHLRDLRLPRQIAFYNEGVGTESWWPRRVLSGATGRGLRQNVERLYAEIARVYRRGDRLYLFGFSRGAFTARVLSGLIDCCGIPDAAEYRTAARLEVAVHFCYEHYLRLRQGTDRPPAPGVVCHERDDQPVIEFLGVWDTVDSVGLPFKVADWWNEHVFRFKLGKNRRLVPSARYGCQALALDDPREAFQPVLWDRDDDRVEQVWFAGAHSNVGGGYTRHGLSLIPLRWMMARAAARGLRFSESDRTYIDEHQTVADKLYDPRTGTALFYRWRPRDVTALCTAQGVEPQVHISAFDRLAQGVDAYAPTNIPLAPRIVFTERRDWALIRPAAIRAALDRHATQMIAAHERGQRVVAGGRQSYLLFVLATLLLVAAGLASLVVAAATLMTSPPLWPKIAAIVTGGVGAVLLVAAYTLAERTDSALEEIYGALWHEMRSDLLAALTRAEVVSSADVPAGGRSAVASAAVITSP